MGTGTLYLCPYLCFFSLLLYFSICVIIILLFSFSASQVFSASSLSPPVQTGTGLLLNAFSWASTAPDIVGVAAVNNTGGTLFGRSPAVEWAAPMLLGGGMPAAIDEAAVQADAGRIPFD